MNPTVLHLSYSDLAGGASRSAYYLHRGLIEIGHPSRMLVAAKHSTDEAVIESVTKPTAEAAFPWETIIEGAWIHRNRTSISNTWFSLGYPGHQLENQLVHKEVDLFHLHWINRLLSPTGIAQLLRSGKPVVWTFHDQWALTGGCHYTSGCNAYQTQCRDCPQLLSDPHGLVPASHLDKQSLWSKPGPDVIVCPSHWLAECVRASAVFREQRVEVIPYGIDTNLFLPTEKKAARAHLNLPQDALYLLFLSYSADDRRKGLHEFCEALKILQQNSSLSQALQNGKIRLLLVGGAVPELLRQNCFEFPTHSWGRIEDGNELALLYSAADAFVLPTLEDNLPNTMIESLACGTPVIAFSTGGVPDVVRDNENGLLISTGEASQLAEALGEFLSHADLRLRLSSQARPTVEQDHTLAIQAQRYQKLYEELMEIKNRQADLTAIKPIGTNLNRVIEAAYINGLEKLVNDLFAENAVLEEKRAMHLTEKRRLRDEIKQENRNKQDLIKEIESLRSNKWLKIGKMLGLVKKNR